jgi:hypothetical protein
MANEKLVKNHEQVASNHLKENIYIHTDKDIYEPGENIWFKAYILQGNDLKISKDTGVIFAELRNPQKNSSVAKEMYSALNGFADGHLYLHDSLSDGNYQLIIHTKKTLESTSKTILANKQITLKKNIIPKILFDTEFSQKTYKRTDEVVLNIHLFSRSRLPFKETSIRADIFSATKRIGRVKVKTDADGQVQLTIPAKKNANAAYLKLRVRIKDEIIFHTVDIPFENPADIQFGMYPESGNLVENLPNIIAFKAVDHHGNPIDVEGQIYENGKELSSFTASHFGMGKFLLTPKPSHNYTVKITNPVIDSVFQLPRIHKNGVLLHAKKSDAEHLRFSILKTPETTLEKVYIRVQNRGKIHWMAIASLAKNYAHFKVPFKQLPQGIMEVTLFDENYTPLSERLVYSNLTQKLDVKLETISKYLFKQKEKVDLEFSVTDQLGNPAVGHFSLSVFDHLYANKDNDYAMLPHYYLFSDLKGHIYDASYYFNEKNKNRAQHLDLLLLTQGWRRYTWNETFINDSPEKIVTFHEEIKGRAYEFKKGKIVKNANNTEIQVVLPQATLNFQTDLGGNFTLPIIYQKSNPNAQIFCVPAKKEKVKLEIEFPFDNISNHTKHKLISFPKSDRIIAAKKQSSYDPTFSFTDTNYLEEVSLTGFKDRKKNKANNYYGSQLFSNNDYVCQNDILNCRNHSGVSAPIEGRIYRLNNGQLIKYKAPTIKGMKEDPDFIVVRGFHPKKEFYTPVYDHSEERLFPDNRKTLYWSPNLISDADGKIKVTFYTSDVQAKFLGKLEGTNGNGLLGATSFTFDVN